MSAELVFKGAVCCALVAALNNDTPLVDKREHVGCEVIIIERDDKGSQSVWSHQIFEMPCDATVVFKKEE